MLSEPNARILSFILAHDRVVFSNDLPREFSPLRLDGLVFKGYIHRAVHPSGIIVYQLLPAGEDALSEKQWSEHKVVEEIARKQADDESRALERAQDKRREFWYFVAGLIFGWLFGLITPVDVWLWLRRSAELLWSMLH